MKRFFRLWMLLVPMALGIASCTDTIDNPVVNPNGNLVTDDKTWTIGDDMMDRSVLPGDNFFMYCNGTWWKNTELTDASIVGYFRSVVAGKADEMASSLTYPTQTKLVEDLKNLDGTTEAAQEVLARALELIEGAETQEQVWQVIGKLLKEGYSTPIKLYPFSVNGKMAICIGFNDGEKDFGYDEDGEDDDEDLGELLRKDSRVLSHVMPISPASMTRGIDTERWPLFRIVCEAIGLSPEDAYTMEPYIAANSEETPDLEEMAAKMDQLQHFSVEKLTAKLLECVLSDNAITSTEAMEEYNASVPEEAQLKLASVFNIVKKNYLKYADSRAIAEQYTTPEMKSRAYQTAEELRNTFVQRIQRSDWLTDASKTNAIEKLQAITINVAYPDEWFEEGFADISGEKSFLEDVMALRRADLALKLKLVGMDNKRGGFHELMRGQDALTVANAFYVQNFNSINIYPIWLMTPLYDETQNDAINYATYTVFAHEISHGFDTNGSRFDKRGDLNPIWATEADEQEYLRRAQGLADYFSGIQVLPEEMPGVYANGEHTLAENIADLGGFEIAFEAYTDHLSAEGFKGEELLKQQRRFYQAYANLWRAKYGAAWANNMLYVEQDTHSLEKERINGIVPNTDAWYDLFNVQPGQKMYLAPEERIRIW